MAVKNNKSCHDNTIGQIFTPNYIAEFMVKNMVNILKDYYRENNKVLKLDEIKVLEPASGRGVFLTYLLENNFKDITAYEIDHSLKSYLKSTYPEVQFKFQDFLSSDPDEKYDLIIGNPPYLGQNYHSSVFQALVQNYDICEKYFIGNMDLFYYFIHLGIEKLKPGGVLSYITTNYWITKSIKTGIEHLKPHIIKECFFLHYYDLSNLKIFKDAQGQHNCIFVLQKKTVQQQKDRLDKSIQVYQYRKDRALNDDFTKQNFITYQSGLTNFDLEELSHWNLLYPNEIKKVVEDIETYCSKNGKMLLLKDIFLIRNGLILIKDDLFILKKNKNIKVANDEIFIKIDNQYHRLNKFEKERLKKLYKSKSILPFGYDIHNSNGFLIYFNRHEFKHQRGTLFNQIQRRYPTLTKYILSYEGELKQTLQNAKENYENIYFPRRGGYITISNGKGNREKIDLEPYYDNIPKIFLSYISDKNVFGFSSTQYYATSDTYFLWPKRDFSKIDYPFWLAYLNSKVVSFLFKAKNITIKRSKTKLEYCLPIPNLTNLQSKQEKKIISLISNLSILLIEVSLLRDRASLDDKNKKITEFLILQEKQISEVFAENFFKNQIVNSDVLIKAIDILFFRLFNLDEEKIDYLIKKYYYS